MTRNERAVKGRLDPTHRRSTTGVSVQLVGVQGPCKPSFQRAEPYKLTGPPHRPREAQILCGRVARPKAHVTLHAWKRSTHYSLYYSLPDRAPRTRELQVF